MGYRFGSFYYRAAEDGFDIYESSEGETDQVVDWMDTHTAAENECRRRYIAVLEKKYNELKQDYTKLSCQVDDMQHDFGVIAFCGLSMSKNDKESFRSEDAIPALQTLEQERDKRITLDNELEQAQGEIAALLEYAKDGCCADEECSDLPVHSENGLALFNQLKMLTTEEQVSAFLSGEVKRLDGEVKPMKEALTLIAEGRMHEYFETHPVEGVGLFLNPAQVIAREILNSLNKQEADTQ